MTLNELEAMRDIAVRKEKLEQRIETIRSCLERCTARQPDGMPRASNDDRTIAIYNDLLEINKQLAEEIISLEQKIKDAQEWLEDLNADEAKIIRLRFFHGMKWQKIAQETNFSESNVFRIFEGIKKYRLTG